MILLLLRSATAHTRDWLIRYWQ